MTVSPWVLGIGCDAKYRTWTSSHPPLNQITRKSRMTGPPEIVQDMPARFSRGVKTVLQAASGMPEPMGRRWLL